MNTSRFLATGLSVALLSACSPSQLPSPPESFQKKENTLVQENSAFLQGIEKTSLQGWSTLYSNKETSYYIKPSMVQKTDNETRVLIVRLMSTPEPLIVQSLEALDCSTPNKSRVVGIQTYNPTTQTINPMILEAPEWQVSDNETVGSLLWSKICKGNLQEDVIAETKTTFGDLQRSSANLYMLQYQFREQARLQDISYYSILPTSYGAIVSNSTTSSIGGLAFMSSMVFFKTPTDYKGSPMGYMYTANGYNCSIPGAYVKNLAFPYDTSGNLLIPLEESIVFPKPSEIAPPGTDAYTLWEVACQGKQLAQQTIANTQALNFYKAMQSTTLPAATK